VPIAVQHAHPELELVFAEQPGQLVDDDLALEGTVIADCVNVACRLEALCKEQAVRIVTTEECLAASKDRDRYPTRFLGALPVHGKVEPVRTYEVVVA
jgi:class 3 adenylate cyclase